MTLDYQRLRSWPFGVIEHAYTEKDTILYALGVGLGMDPLDERQLRFVCEENLVAMPTQAVVLGFPGFWAKHPDSTIDWVRLLLGAHSLRIHRPLQPRGVVIAHNAVTRVIDKGAGKGALVVTERQLLEKGSGELLATLEQLSFCRGDGGYSMPGAAHPAGQPSDPPLPDPPAVPDGAPDLICDLATPSSIACRAISTRSMLIHRLRLRPASRAPSCMGSPPMASPVTRFFEVAAIIGRSV